MVGRANRAAMNKAAKARRSHAEPVVPRPENDSRQTPAWFGERPWHTRTSSMKVEELYVDTGPIRKSGCGSMFAECSILRKPCDALKLTIRALDLEFIRC